MKYARQYYMCTTEEGQELAATQAAARKLDPKFKSHEVPTKKDELMEYINDLLRRAQGVPRRAIIDPAPKKTEGDDRPMAVPVSCVDVHNRTEIEHALWATDERGLRNLEEVIAERRRELEGK